MNKTIDGPGNSTADPRGLERAELAAWEDYYRSVDPDLARRLGLRLEERDGALISAVAKADVLALNRVVGLGPLSFPDEDDVGRLVEEYARIGVQRFFVQVSPTCGDAGVVARLQARGFRHYNNWVKLERGVTEPPQIETDLEVREIGREHARDFGEIVARCFQWPDELADWASAPVGRKSWRHYLAFDGKTPAAVGAFFVAGESAWIGFAATLPEYRNRGAQRALLARRIEDATRLGCRTLTAETAEDTTQNRSVSLNNLLAMGFRVAYVRPNYIYVVEAEGGG